MEKSNGNMKPKKKKKVSAKPKKGKAKAKPKSNKKLTRRKSMLSNAERNNNYVIQVDFG